MPENIQLCEKIKKTLRKFSQGLFVCEASYSFVPLNLFSSRFDFFFTHSVMIKTPILRTLIMFFDFCQYGITFCLSPQPLKVQKIRKNSPNFKFLLTFEEEKSTISLGGDRDDLPKSSFG